jgi:anti-sigma B factor antagonist
VLPELTMRELHGCTVVELCGEFDLTCVPALEQFLGEVLAGPAPVIILDLNKTEFADVTAMRAVLGAERRASARGRRLVLAAPHSAVSRLLEITGFGWHFSVFATAEEAALRKGTVEDAAAWTPMD